MAEELPREVREIITRRLHHMEDIELLLLLAAAPGSMSLSAIGESLRLSGPTAVMPSVHRLVAADLVATETSGGETHVRYAPASAALRRAVELLGVAYNERPVTLVRLVYNRRSAAQSFADAFRLRGEDEP